MIRIDNYKEITNEISFNIYFKYFYIKDKSIISKSLLLNLNLYFSNDKNPVAKNINCNLKKMIIIFCNIIVFSI